MKGSSIEEQPVTGSHVPGGGLRQDHVIRGRNRDCLLRKGKLTIQGGSGLLR